ncbi:hypothetical protein ABMB44_14485 [Levilactobacillus brevis]
MHEIIQLFSKRAVVKGANGFVADNPTRVAEFFKNFFKDNQELRHLFHVVVNDGNYQAEWAVAGRKRSGKIFALRQINEKGRILYKLVRKKTAKYEVKSADYMTVDDERNLVVIKKFGVCLSWNTTNQLWWSV